MFEVRFRFLQPDLLVTAFREKNGGRTWARTKDPLIKSQLLYQLSYASIPFPALP